MIDWNKRGSVLMADQNCIGGIHYELMRRCYDKKSVVYKSYGAKGIEVCLEWHDRENFRRWAKENGWKKGLRINRIDNAKNYTTDNCYFGDKNCLDKNQKVKSDIEHRKQMREWAGIKGNISCEPLYKKYLGMIARCYRRDHIAYPNYGGRGISICDEWLGYDGFCRFYKWSMENGYESGFSIDRIDNDGDYSSSNCRWTTVKEQNENRRSNIRYSHNGCEMTLSQIARVEGAEYNKLYRLIKIKGMNVCEAIRQCSEAC